MINRLSKIRFIQTLLLIVGCFTIFFTYFKYDIQKEKIISSTDKQKIKNKSLEESDFFYNIKYTGLDLQGNRYVLTSKEAMVKKNLQEIVNMSFVNAIFYFKDNTTLTIDSDAGVYNNKTLDMIFEKNVKAYYEGSELLGDKIIYLNSNKTLEVLDNVKLTDVKGTMSADKLLFDIGDQKLDISSFNNGKINANLNLDEKRF